MKKTLPEILFLAMEVKQIQQEQIQRLTSDSIVPSEELIEEIPGDGSYGKTFDEENSEFWFKFTPEESGTYIISSVSSGLDPKVYLFDNREITSKNDYIAENDDGHVNPDNESDFYLSYNLTAGQYLLFLCRRTVITIQGLYRLTSKSSHQ